MFTLKQHSLILLVCILVQGSTSAQQVADSAFTFPVKTPAYAAGTGTRIVLDEAHYNFHTLGGRYFSFGKVLEADGYVLQPGTHKFSDAYLDTLRLLVIANALADTGAWRLPARSGFTKEEVKALHDWVQQGGSLFLIADHMPFPGVVSDIARSFGFNMINGFALKRGNSPEMYSRSRGNLLSNAITKGRWPEEQVDSVLLITGQAFIAPQAAGILTRLDTSYRVYLPQIAWEITDTTACMEPEGLVNGACMEYGRGRIVMMGEAAMFSAQLAGASRNKMGMNHPSAKQNAQLLLNIVHWLDRKL
ncbi:MAG: hypothetical protein JNL88_11590 [Bacteroidia bacterium]|nr:hypothetical protein [Bacteroidia bacterium]